MEKKSTWKSFGGDQHVFEHASSVCDCTMAFSVFLPEGYSSKTPVLWFLSGLTCSWENVTTKGGFQKYASEHGIAVICPDTSPRGEQVPDEEGWDFGIGAGFYVDATEAPFNRHYNMYSYVTQELPELVFNQFDLNRNRQGVTGHSMGGHGALVIGLRNPDRYQTVSAFSPIVAPSTVGWGEKAFTKYLGTDRQTWAKYDATELVKSSPRSDTLLIHQGRGDNFLDLQLQTWRIEDAAKSSGQPLSVRMIDGYDHSFYFISTFMEEHIAFHAA